MIYGSKAVTFNYKDWYWNRGGREQIKERRDRRYHGEPEYRRSVLDQNTKSYRKKKEEDDAA